MNLFILFFIKDLDLIELTKNPIFRTIHVILAIGSIINWFYCLWFWNKYDKFSKSGLLLYFPHILYAPFYYYQVKIKKRPLKGQQPSRPVLLGQKTEIEDREMVESTRENILDILASYQTEPGEDEEKRNLLDCWFDFVQADDAHFKAAFNEDERTILAYFEEQLTIFRSAIHKEAPTDTFQWGHVQQLSESTMAQLRTK
ncbi:MAG: hypothetical protein JEZ14_08930 [Marinilabiliaceae bacterium]|nr:hypothetical protein [Marinilabiliaceae bacterium]